MRFLLVLVFACGGASHGGETAKSRKLGAITGLARDINSAEAIAGAEVEIAGRKTKSRPDGMYEIDGLAPGLFTVHAEFAGQRITVHKVEVSPGIASYVDLSFTLGDIQPLVTDWGDSRESQIKIFKVTVPRIEGTVGDGTTRERVAGAVVTAARGPDDETLQTITDDHGRYRFDAVDLGTYAISAYYSIGGRAQIEVRRSEVTVKAGEAVFVPLWIEMAKQ